ncbi:protein DOUBLE-STRAND BREAK FORMATION [Mangifera indica]|uniref:protein DOUBLE-STRAND BREAK FORMATION n=1 Tax=Mangifera indica TaxID=29780 RepID=UPI001CFA467D|nr:protein DOUBLE-STRAND BREAK FORMATION [Mangifera indica]
MSSAGFDHQISLFRSQINDRRFDGGTIQILESLLVCKDVKSLIEVQSNLREFLRSESMSVLREIAEKTLEQKLLILEFFVLAFAVIGDTESCLALRYEALLMRDIKSASCNWLQVAYVEWLNLAEHSLENGFHAIAIKACENAQSCLQRNDIVDLNTVEISEYVQATENTRRLKDCAVTSVASLSVQAQATEYLKKKIIVSHTKHSPCCKGTKRAASTLFRNGIKRRNVNRLLELQGLR